MRRLRCETVVYRDRRAAECRNNRLDLRVGLVGVPNHISSTVDPEQSWHGRGDVFGEIHQYPHIRRALWTRDVLLTHGNIGEFGYLCKHLGVHLFEQGAHLRQRFSRKIQPGKHIKHRQDFGIHKMFGRHSHLLVH